MAYPILASRDTWYTQGGTSILRTSITEIHIKDSYTPTGTVTEQWDGSAAKDGSITVYIEGTKLTIAGNGSGKIKVTDGAYMFSGKGFDKIYKNLLNINGLTLLDLSDCTNLASAFAYCSKLESADITGWDTKNCTNMQGMFRGNSNPKLGPMNITNIKGLEGLNVSNVTNMSLMFVTCYRLESLDLSKWDVKNVKTFDFMFASEDINKPMMIKSIGNVSNWNTENAESFKCMFQYCNKLNSIDLSGWNFNKCKTASQMFFQCSSIESIIMPSKSFKIATDLYGLFGYCKNLKNIENTKFLVNENANNISYMFFNCRSIISIDISEWNTINCTNMQALFGDCVSLTDIDTTKINTSNCTDISFIFYECASLKSIDVSSWDVSKCKHLNSIASNSKIIVNGIETWKNSIAENIEGMCDSWSNECIDLRGFKINNIKSLYHLFINCSNLVEIKGIDTFNTENCINFGSMFSGCTSIKKIDLSSFNTKKATKAKNGCMKDIFYNCSNIEIIKLGPNFSYNGDGTELDTSFHAHLPSTINKSDYDGKWYTIKGKPYGPEEAIKTVPNTYYVSRSTLPNPTLPPKNGWYTQGGTAISKKTITEIAIKDTYTPAGTVTEQWDGSADKNGTITIYVEGTKITIAGNNSGKILVNQDGSLLFGRDIDGDYFKVCTSISGLELLDVTNTKTLEKAFYGCFAVEYLPGIETWNIEKCTSLAYAFSNNRKLKTVDISRWNVSNCESLSNLFSWDKELLNIDLTSWRPNKVINLSSLFYLCEKLKTVGDLSEWRTPKCEKFTGSFGQCLNLEKQKLENWDVSSGKEFSHMFADAFNFNGVLDLSKWDMHNAVDISAMFNDCNRLEVLNISGWNTSNVQTTSQMFERCSSLKQIIGIEDIDISKIGFYVCDEFGTQIGMCQMFLGCSSLTSLDLSKWNTSFSFLHQEFVELEQKAYAFWDKHSPGQYTHEEIKRWLIYGAVEEMFEGCTSLVSINLSGWDTSNIGYFGKMFKNCSKLKFLDLFSFDFSKIEDCTEFLYGCSMLEKVSLPKGTLPADSINILPTPNSTYIAEADGNWYDTLGNTYTPEEAAKAIPNTFYASKKLISNILAPDDTWYTGGGTSINKETITHIDIKDSYTPVGTVTEQWDGSAAKDGSITVYIEGTKLTIAGNGSGKIRTSKKSNKLFNGFSNADDIIGLSIIDSNDTEEFTYAFSRTNIKTVDFIKSWNFRSLIDCTAMFRSCNSLAKIELDGMNFPMLKVAFAMFDGCENALSAKISNWKTPKLEKLGYFFGWMHKVREILMDNIDTHNVNTMTHMCADCYALTNVIIKNIDTSSCKNFGALFNDCGSLKEVDLSCFDTSSAIAFSQMFERCRSLKRIYGLNNFNTEKAGLYREPMGNGNEDRQSGFGEMFSGCSSLEEVDLSSFKCIEINHECGNEFYPPAGYMFANCSSLKSITFNNTFKIDNANYMFLNCSSLERCNLKYLDVSGCYYFIEMFNGCSNLKELDLMEWDTKNGVHFENILSNCNNLRKITLGSLIKYDGHAQAKPPFLTLNTPNSATIPDADGNWYDISGNAYSPEDAPKTVPNIYYASRKVVSDARNDIRFIKYGTLADLGESIRNKKNDRLYRKPREMKDAIDSLVVPIDGNSLLYGSK